MEKSDGLLHIETIDGVSAQMSLETQEGERSFFLTIEGEKLLLPPFWFLSPHEDERLQAFDSEVNKLNLFGPDIEGWRTKLLSGPLSDEEVDDLEAEFAASPGRVIASIQSSIERGSSSIGELIPNERKYYERLIGRVGEETTLQEYVDGIGKQHIDRLLEWDSHAGLRQSLLMSAQQTVPTKINNGKFDVGNLIEEFPLVI